LTNARVPNGQLVQSIELVTSAPKRIGRGLALTKTCTAQFADSNDIKSHEIADSVNFQMQGWDVPKCKVSPDGRYDIGVVVAFGYKIPDYVISSFKKGIVNIHPSLLPLYRGAAPMQHTLMQGESTTGMHNDFTRKHFLLTFIRFV
jgi:methionyl-tRNA formyltransferase